MNQPAHPDRKAVETAEGWITELSDLIDVTLIQLTALQGFFKDEPLPQALVGAMAIDLGRAREHVPALRQALRDLPTKEESPRER